MSISIKNVVKKYGNFLALDNVSLEVPDGSLLALLGPSGSWQDVAAAHRCGLGGG